MELCIYVPLADYLSQWFIHQHGSCEPVHLIRGSAESKVLEVWLTTRPNDLPLLKQPEGTVAVAIPYFRNKPPLSYNHLPTRAMAVLIRMIRERFDIQLWDDLHSFGNISSKQEDLVFAWMESNGIELTERNCWAITKRYQRLRNEYNARRRAKEYYSRKKSV